MPDALNNNQPEQVKPRDLVIPDDPTAPASDRALKRRELREVPGVQEIEQQVVTPEDRATLDAYESVPLPMFKAPEYFQYSPFTKALSTRGEATQQKPDFDVADGKALQAAVDAADSSSWSVSETLSSMRDAYHRFRATGALAAVDVAVQWSRSKHEFLREKLGETGMKIMTDDDVSIALGLLDIPIRMQGSLFRLLRAEPKQALAYLVSPVTLHNVQDEYGHPVETFPAAEAAYLIAQKLDPANWGDEFSGDPMKLLAPNQVPGTSPLDTRRARLFSANIEGASHIMPFREVRDKPLGVDLKDWNDQNYLRMNDGGFWGKAGLTGLTAVDVLGEILVDPQFLLMGVGEATVKSLRKASPVQHAIRTGEVASITRGYSDILDARNAALRNLQLAIERNNVKPTDRTALEMRMSLRHYLDMEDKLRFFKDSGEGYDPVVFLAMDRRNPSTLEGNIPLTMAMSKYEKPADWSLDMFVEFMLAEDKQAGRKAMFDVVDDDVMWGGAGANYFHLPSMRRIDPRDARLPAYARDMYDVMRSIAARMGIKLDYVDGVKFFGAYAPGNRRLFMAPYVNEWAESVGIRGADSSGHFLSTFQHEMMHHVWWYTFSGDNIAQAELLDKMKVLGFDWQDYIAKLNAGSGSYYGMGHADTADEFTARFTSYMMQEPEFWEAMAKADPQGYTKFADEVMDILQMMDGHVDTVAGDVGVQTYFAGENEARAFSSKVQGMIIDTYTAHPELRSDFLDSAIEEVGEELARLRQVRDVAEGHADFGEALTSIDLAIAESEAYLKRLEEEGIGATVDHFYWRYLYPRSRDVEEVRQIMEFERRNAALAVTQPVRRAPPDVVQGDLFEDAATAARVAQGPSVSESVGDGLASAVNGADPADDVRLSLAVDPYMIDEPGSRHVQGTKGALINLDESRKTLWEARKKAMKEQGRTQPTLVEGVKSRKYGETLRELTKQRDKAVREARKNGDKVAMEKARAEFKVKRKALKEQLDADFDAGWLPRKPETPREELARRWYEDKAPGFWESHQKALYPRTWSLRSFGRLNTLRNGFMHLRQPMRVLEEVDPGRSWPILRTGLMNMENERARLNSVFSTQLKRFGALSVEEPGALKKVAMTEPASTRTVDEKMSERLFDILNTPTSLRESDQYKALLHGLTDEQLDAIEKIRYELDVNAHKLGYVGTDKFIDGYIHHAIDSDLYANGGAQWEFEGMSRNGNVFVAFALDRTGKATPKRDAVAALEVYSRGVGRKLFLEPTLQRLKERARVAARINPKNKFYTGYMDLLIANLKGERSVAGKYVDFVSKSVGLEDRLVSRRAAAISSMTYAGLLTGNRHYPIMSIATALNTTTAQYGFFRTVKGMFRMATPEGQRLFKSVGGSKLWDKILEEQAGTANFASIASRIRLLGPSIQDVEYFIRGVSFITSMEDLMARNGYRTVYEADAAGSLREIMFQSLVSTEQINHYFGPGAKPPMFQRASKSGSQAGLQFMSFGPMQTEALVDMFKDNPGKIADFLIVAGWMSRVASQELGVDIDNYLGFNYLDDTKPGDTAPVTDLILKTFRYMQEWNDVSGGYGSVEDMERAGQELSSALETLFPGGRMADELFTFGDIAESGGRVERPGVGYGRDVQMDYITIGGQKYPVPGGPKGDRNEFVGFATGAMTEEESNTRKARQQIRAEKNNLLVRRMELINEAKRLADGGDTDKFMEKARALANLGVGFSNLKDVIQTKKEIEILDWTVTEIRQTPEMADHFIDILSRNRVNSTDIKTETRR